MILGLITDHLINKRKIIAGGQLETIQTNGIGKIPIVTGTVVITGKKRHNIWPDVNTIGNDTTIAKTNANDGIPALINKTIHQTAIGKSNNSTSRCDVPPEATPCSIVR